MVFVRHEGVVLTIEQQWSLQLSVLYGNMLPLSLKYAVEKGRIK